MCPGVSTIYYKHAAGVINEPFMGRALLSIEACSTHPKTKDEKYCYSE